MENNWTNNSNLDLELLFLLILMYKIGRHSYRRGLKNPYSQFYHRLSVMFPKEFYINTIPQIPQPGLSRGRENYEESISGSLSVLLNDI